MAKKKKTLKVAVLASVFAMTFSTAAWATENYSASNNGPTTTKTDYFNTKINNGTYYFHGADYDITNSDKRGFHANPTLQGQGGIGDGVADAASRAYGYDYNYYLQWGEYYDQGDYWDRITGVKLIEGNSATNGKWEVALSGNEKVTVTAVQLHHVLFDKTTGQAVAADGTDINSVFLHDTANSSLNHYCGESAQSVTIGQLQRINEINYMNFESIANGIKANDTRIDTLEVGWNIKVGSTINNIQANDTVEFAVKEGEKNLTIDMNGDTIKFGFADNPEFESVKIDNTTINTTNNGDLSYTYNNITKTIATTDDGMKFGADNTTLDSSKVIDLELNQQLNINGDGNIFTTADTSTNSIKVELSKNLTGLESITVNEVTVNEQLVIGQGATAITVVEGEIKNVTNVETESITLGSDNSTTNITFNDNRIVYVDDNKEQQVANLNDYITYTADEVIEGSNSNSAEVKLRENLAIKGDKNLTTFVNPESKEVQVTLNDKLVGLKEVNSTIVNSTTVNTHDINVSNVVNVGDNVTINNNGLTIEGDTTKVVINETKVDVGGNRIENVADGVNPTDAVNVRQLDKLGNRVDKVGAGAAALAALHPLDFDPDDKLSFSAGVGNYGGETASALGMFYRPTEKVMLSAAGTMGNGENMVNMGVTFALDRKNNVSNSRVAMAREIQDLREQVAALTALVTQLAGRNNPVLIDTVMFPDVPENHWAYDYIEGLQKRGIVEGYPDGNFGGDRSMTRYEYAAMLYRALEKGFPVDSRLLDEFDAELGRIRIDRIKGLDDDGNKIERVRVNQYEGRDDYGSKLTTVNEAE